MNEKGEGGKMTKDLSLSAASVILYEADKACGERSAKRPSGSVSDKCGETSVKHDHEDEDKIWEA